MGRIQVVWFKRDLRCWDHRPLAAAAARGPVLPLYVLEPELWQQPDRSGRQAQFIAGCLESLAADLRRRGAPLCVLRGEMTTVLDGLQRCYGHFELCAHEETGSGWTFERDRAVRRWCRERGVRFQEWPQHGVGRGSTGRDGWAARWRAFMRAPLTPAPERLAAAALAAFGKRLRWHCHFIQKLEDQPSIEHRNLLPASAALRADSFDADLFERWCRGRTGFPLVDACMRMLLATGWLNFRMRAMW